MTLDQLKKEAAAKALTYVEDGMVLGLGSGSTAAHFVRLLGERVKGGLTVRGVPTSEATARLAEACGVALTTLAQDPHLDLAVDGADEFDPRLQLTKGGGGALLREKIVAGAAKRFIVICDATKQVEQLGAFPLPVEVIPFASAPVGAALAALGGHPTLRMADGKPYLTDEQNYIFDCAFGRIDDPRDLGRRLNAIPGVVEHGLFIDMTSLVIMAAAGRIQTIEGAQA